MFKFRNIKRSKLLGALFAGAGLTIFPAIAPADSLTSDFSANGGLNNWSYGYYTSPALPATFAKFPDYFTGTFDDDGFEEYSKTVTPSDPVIVYNTGSYDYVDGPVDFQPGQVTLGPSGGPTVVRYTVPTTGVYDINSTFTTVETVNSPPMAYIYETKQDPLLGPVTIQLAAHQLEDSPSDGQIGTPWTPAGLTDVPLIAGTTIDFVVGDDGLKSTQLKAFVSAVPLPRAMLGGIVLFGCVAAFKLVRCKPFVG